jgi:2-polyprenyl-3-methyl-5-hydroxy-6-metoxy-1,4-benzoquinol methylase
MIPELAQSPYQVTPQLEDAMGTTVKYLTRKVKPHSKILDVGQKNPLTELLSEGELKLSIDNTEGDLDVFTITDDTKYDYILYSHTIEHQFNPLHTLLELKKVMKEDTLMFIILPRRGKLLWCRGHFHEIDDYRMRLLLDRAGLDIVTLELHKAWRPWYFYLTGFKPILRLFLEYNAYYEVRLTR